MVAAQDAVGAAVTVGGILGTLGTVLFDMNPKSFCLTFGVHIILSPFCLWSYRGFIRWIIAFKMAPCRLQSFLDLYNKTGV